MRIPSISLEGKVALVTGARRGIGRDTALVLAEAGADVAVCDLVADNGELTAVENEIKKIGRRALSYRCDVKDKTIVNRMVQDVADKFGRIDILVNNAGIGDPGGPTEPEMSQEREKKGQEFMAQLMAGRTGISLYEETAFEKVLENNLRSVLVCSRAVADYMIKHKQGSIINVSSVAAYFRGSEAFSPYSISKRGIVMLTEGLAVDLARHNIRVNAIAPGGIETEMMRDVWSHPELLKWVEPKMLLGNKLIKPVECAYVILFLVSDLAHYITGQTVTIDAGYSIAP